MTGTYYEDNSNTVWFFEAEGCCRIKHCTVIEDEETGESFVVENGELIYYHLVHPNRQHDPKPSETLTIKFTLDSFPSAPFHPKSCKWEKLVRFFLNHTNYMYQVKNNGVHMGGSMWDGGWRKSLTKGESFETRLMLSWRLKIRLIFIFKKWLLEFLESTMQFSLEKSPFHGLKGSDFSSFFTFTMYNLLNKDHKDNDIKTWTFVCWIPLFNLQTFSKTDPILSNKGFKRMGGSGNHILCLQIKLPYPPDS
ncbi:uncharacterized protein VP01_118g4 [Puccinia sorghi]|uniref:Tet-like 2OG-Fe(II) oxygenase domain-containing protein n=1 Tax=Puccinia sorghi TaxID=27349 RepID=A0A0L6VSB9_9BASI|nr:uncharacterized protein VP01_118g4 [Puccinia sorghi]